MGGFESLAAIFSVTIAIVTVFFTWRQDRRAELRKDDVLKWGLECITSLRTLVIVMQDNERGENKKAADIDNLRVELSVQAEQGRLFFRNVEAGTKECAKVPAYRGYRPRILDLLVFASKVAVAWPTSDAPTRHKLGWIADDCQMQFVSLLQQEVGRAKTFSNEPASGGEAFNLEELLRNAKPRQ